MSHENGIPSRVVEGEPLLDLIGDQRGVGHLAVDGVPLVHHLLGNVVLLGEVYGSQYPVFPQEFGGIPHGQKDGWYREDDEHHDDDHDGRYHHVSSDLSHIGTDDGTDGLIILWPGVRG